jgi:16S rRNA (guanine1516-N2)-methyltransferase
MTDIAVAILREPSTESRLLQLGREDLLLDDPRFAFFPDLGAWQQSAVPYLLAWSDDRLQLLPQNKKLQPLSVDFTGGTLGFRAQQSVRNEMIVKAVLGRDKQSLPEVIDATAGLGRDSYLLATLGCQVLMVERHPVVGALLQDGLTRFQDQGDPLVAARLQFCCQDFARSATLDQARVVYLDPMFPKREKSALVKKDMQIFKAMVGADSDSDELLPAARALATERVVVKRPLKAPFLGGEQPTYSLSGRSSRFDIYQVGSRTAS